MDLLNFSAAELGKLIASRQISASEVLASVFERIDKTESTVNSFIRVDRENALETAKKLDAKQDAASSSLLYGVPFAAKDNICTRNFKTTCASKMLENFTPTYDATAFCSLASKGAVCVGKTNLDEFAMGSTTETSYFGPTLNPHDTTRVAGGSSGGSAAAVACGEVFFSLASDTGGSIRQPASFCGVTGIKPTYGTVSRYGLVSFASSLDQIGVIARDAEDCTAALSYIMTHDAKDSTSVTCTPPSLDKVRTASPEGLRIGIPTNFFNRCENSDIKSCVLSAVKQFETNGAHVEEFDFPLLDVAIPAYYIISSAEASSNLSRYDGVRFGHRSKNGDDFTSLCINSRSEGFGTEVKRRIILGNFVLSSEHYESYYIKAQKHRRMIADELHKLFGKYDIIITPTTPSSAFHLNESSSPLQMYLSDLYTVIPNLAGLPAISVPCGFDKDGLPIGMQLIGDLFAEEKLLGTARIFQQMTNRHFCKPHFLKKDGENA